MAGVGGRTIAQAKAALSWSEFHEWMAYRAKHGPLHLQQRVADAAALIALTVSNTAPRTRGSRPLEFADFLLYRPAINEVDGAPIDLETAMAEWR